MDFIDKIRELSARIPKQLENIQTEETTKYALIMPFISALGYLGYNVFDPTEATPELCADVGVKKGEKIFIKKQKKLDTAVNVIYFVSLVHIENRINRSMDGV